MRLQEFLFGRGDVPKDQRRAAKHSKFKVEQLESREMLDASATFLDGVLSIVGSDANDHIRVTRDHAAQQLVVHDHSKEIHRIDAASVKHINIFTGAGNDHVTISSEVGQPAFIDAGSGNDVVQAGGGSATIYGGDGNDILIGGDQNDAIFGEDGNDRLDGGRGHDTLYGGAGKDKLEGGIGHDELLGGSGNDLARGGFGNDVIYGHGGNGTVGAQGGGLSLDAAGEHDDAPAEQVNDKLDGDYGNDDIVAVPGTVLAQTLAAVQPDVDISNPANLQQLGFDAVESAENLTANEVQTILDRASAATSSNDAIIVVVDRNGRILGVRVEDGVSPTILNDPALLTFAIDGALAKARTGAFFANNGAPLTSRTVQFISQTTILEREVNSNPNIPDENSTLRGPGFVAPIGINGHFPTVPQTPTANLFAIEHTNRDSQFHPGSDGIKGVGAGTAADLLLANRFNINQLAPGAMLFAPDSSGDHAVFTGRGIATLPGGIGIYKNFQLVGGIGVFFPGETGFASEENSILSEDYDPTQRDRSLEAEFIAFAAIGGSSLAGFKIGGIGNAPDLGPAFDVPFGRLDVDGIKVPVFGPLVGGARALVDFGNSIGQGSINGFNATYRTETNAATNATRAGVTPSNGWIVAPTDSPVDPLLTAEVVEQIITQGVFQAVNTRAAIRLRNSGSTTNPEAIDLRPNASSSMVLSVSDTQGNVLGLYRMPDATIFSIDVAVAKSRNTAYYADANDVNPLDLPDDNNDGTPDIPAGTALTNRTFRYLALPYFPSGIDGTQPGDFSILNSGQTDDAFSALNDGPPLPASAFDNSVMGRDAFRPGTNFRDDDSAGLGLTNGIVFFPGSTPIYVDADGDGINETLVGGFGVSGDGVDQDDVVTFAGAQGYQTPQSLRADMYQVRDIRLPFQKFNRNPTHLEK